MDPLVGKMDQERITLVVNGDDFGYSDAINAAIVRCHQDGVLTSATLLVNQRASGAAFALARRLPALGVGLHLNLTAGAPVLPPDQVPSLVDRRGRFRYLDAQLGRLATGRLRLADVERELRAQFATFTAHGLQPSHVDGHLHVQSWPGVLPIVLRLMREYGVRALRSPLLTAWLPARWRQERWWRAQLLARSAVVCAEAMLDAARYHDPASLVAAVAGQPGGLVELMAHPAWTRDAVRGAAQVALLTAPELRAALEAAGIRLASYRDLALPDGAVVP
ncbi:MAG: carbohydrate deacetylase [Thermomicrobiales bacterium]